jgi:signal peptidase I
VQPSSPTTPVSRGTKGFLETQIEAKSEAMGSTVKVGSRWKTIAGVPAAGDIVAYNLNVANEARIGRLVLIGPATFACTDGKAVVDGTALRETYLAADTVTNCEPVSVKAGECMVLGDNRPNSADSRAFGPINCEELQKVNPS